MAISKQSRSRGSRSQEVKKSKSQKVLGPPLIRSANRSSRDSRRENIVSWGRIVGSRRRAAGSEASGIRLTARLRSLILLSESGALRPFSQDWAAALRHPLGGKDELFWKAHVTCSHHLQRPYRLRRYGAGRCEPALYESQPDARAARG